MMQKILTYLSTYYLPAKLEPSWHGVVQMKTKETPSIVLSQKEKESVIVDKHKIAIEVNGGER